MEEKKVFWALLNAVLIVVIVFGVIGATALLRFSNAAQPSRTITVEGQGSVDIVPDVAKLSFSVVSEGEDPETIEQENSEKVNRAISYLKEQGVESKDIQTENFNLYPRYDYGEIFPGRGERNLSGYEIQQTVSVSIRDLEKAGAIVGGLARNGVNQINYFSFQIDDPEAFKQEAREKAFDNARSKAKALASAADVRIARVVGFSESGGGFGGEIFGRGGMDMAMPQEADLQKFVVPDFEPGQEEITVFVHVVYEIK
ncbi:MAG: SIMPL domain-containing protein [Candidatus Harrisonbacteria bacterium]|nr:SIMPL domain-containing protein [Candidatus Harrisonbacteria bacterium]